MTLVSQDRSKAPLVKISHIWVAQFVHYRSCNFEIVLPRRTDALDRHRKIQLKVCLVGHGGEAGYSFCFSCLSSFLEQKYYQKRWLNLSPTNLCHLSGLKLPGRNILDTILALYTEHGNRLHCLAGHL